MKLQIFVKYIFFTKNCREKDILYSHSHLKMGRKTAVKPEFFARKRPNFKGDPLYHVMKLLWLLLLCEVTPCSVQNFAIHNIKSSYRCSAQADIKDDFVFKQIFGTERNMNLLHSLLKAILQKDIDIHELKICNNEIPKEHKDLRTTLLDIKTQLDSKTYCDLEIQRRNTGDIEERAFHYLCAMEIEHSHPPQILLDQSFDDLPVEEQMKLIEAGYSYKNPTVISIWILGQNINNLPGYRHEMAFQYLEEDKAQMHNKAKIIFLELPKFKKLMKNRIKFETMLEIWLAFLNDPFDKRIPSNIEEIKIARSELKQIQSNAQIRHIIQDRRQTNLDRLSAMTTAFQNGFQKGLNLSNAKYGVPNGN